MSRSTHNMIAAHSYGSLGKLCRGLGGRSHATPRVPGFDPRPVHVLLVADRVALRKGTHLLHASTYTHTCIYSRRQQRIIISRCLLFLAQQPPVGQGLLIHEVSRSHTTTHGSRQDSSGRVISSSQRPLPDNTTLTTDRHPCPRWDSNPQS